MNFRQLKDFNYIYFSKAIDIEYIERKNILASFLKCILKGFVFTIHLIKTLATDTHAFSSKGKIVFFCMSENNYVSLRPIQEMLPQSTSTIFGDRKFNKQVNLFIPTVIASWISILFFPKILIDFFSSDKGTRELFKRGMNDVVLTYPFYYTSNLWFKLTKPKGIVVANDHVYSTRILVHWANKFNVPSFYIQHASVTDKFPRLEVSYALLEGEDASDKYIKAGSDASKIVLIGIPKLDQNFNRINYNKKIASIGVASNGLEPIQAVYELISFLHTCYPELQIIYRPHRVQYSDSRMESELTKMIKDLPSDVKLSNPFEEVVTEYLAAIDCLVAGDSAIHLEAVWLNITSIYFFFDTPYFDYYGFVKNDMIDFPKDLNELKGFIDKIKDQRPEVRNRGKRYCHTIGSEFDGKSTELAVNLIREKITNRR